MKKLVSFLTCLFLLISIPVEGMAASSQGSEKVGVLMEEIGVAVSVPADMHVITRETPKNAAVWNRFNSGPDEFIKGMKEDEIYFYAFSEDYSYLVYAWVNDADKNASFSLYDSQQLLNLYDEIIEQEADSNFVAAEKPVYQSDSKTFLVFDRCQDSDSSVINGRQYWTKHGGKNINIKLETDDGEISAHHKTVLEEIVDSMIIEPKPDENDETVVLIPQIGVAAAFPSNLYACTRNTPKDSEVWEAAGFEYEEMTQFLVGEQAYFLAMPSDFSYQIIVRKSAATSNKDFDTMKTDKLEKLYESFLVQNIGENLKACQNPIYHTETKTFLIYDGVSEEKNAYRVFWTVHEGKEIQVYLFSYTGEIEDSHNAILERIADSMIVD